MRTMSFVSVFAGSLALLGFISAPVRADEIPAEYRETVQKGLEYLVKNQGKDGSWAMGGQYPTTMTGVAGMALLMEGSTMREGKYKDNIKRACDYLMSKAQPNGMIGSPNTPGEAGRYTYGHGYATLFLASVYGEEEEGERRKRLEEILTKAAKFSRNAQTDRGGWGYISAKEGGGFDEGSTTITQVQALRRCRNAGIPVPPDAIKMAQKYLKDCQPARRRDLQPGAGRRRSWLARIDGGGDLLRFQHRRLQIRPHQEVVQVLPKDPRRLGDGRMGHDEYTHYYFGQAMYFIGDKGWKEMFPNDNAKDDR